MRKNVLAAALTGIIALTACSSKPPEQHSVTGIIQEVQGNGKTLLIDAQAIPGFMDAMTMPYDLSDPQLAKDLKTGDHVQFTITKNGDSWLITRISK